MFLLLFALVVSADPDVTEIYVPDAVSDFFIGVSPPPANPTYFGIKMWVYFHDESTEDAIMWEYHTGNSTISWGWGVWPKYVISRNPPVNNDNPSKMWMRINLVDFRSAIFPHDSYETGTAQATRRGWMHVAMAYTSDGYIRFFQAGQLMYTQYLGHTLAIRLVNNDIGPYTCNATKQEDHCICAVMALGKPLSPELFAWTFNLKVSSPTNNVQVYKPMLWTSSGRRAASTTYPWCPDEASTTWTSIGKGTISDMNTYVDKQERFPYFELPQYIPCGPCHEERITCLQALSTETKLNELCSAPAGYVADRLILHCGETHECNIVRGVCGNMNEIRPQCANNTCQRAILLCVHTTDTTYATDTEPVRTSPSPSPSPPPSPLPTSTPTITPTATPTIPNREADTTPNTAPSIVVLTTVSRTLVYASIIGAIVSVVVIIILVVLTVVACRHCKKTKKRSEVRSVGEEEVKSNPPAPDRYEFSLADCQSEKTATATTEVNATTCNADVDTHTSEGWQATLTTISTATMATFQLCLSNTSEPKIPLMGKDGCVWVIFPERVLGRGGYGTVVMGQCANPPPNSISTELDKSLHVAVKRVVMDNNESRAELQKEVATMAELDHPNIVRYFDVVYESGELFIVMELVSGGDLSKLRKSRGGVDSDTIRNWLKQVVAGLDYLHARDILHRDIKPLNLLVNSEGIIKLADFGLAKYQPATALNNTTSVKGTPKYLAPETVGSNTTGKAQDIWALGITALEMVSEYDPWLKPEEWDAKLVLSAMQTLFRIASGNEPYIPPDLPNPALRSFIQQCLTMSHSARPTAAQLLHHTFFVDKPSTAPPHYENFEAQLQPRSRSPLGFVFPVQQPSSCTFTSE